MAYCIRQNFYGWYANDHSQKNFPDCLTPSLIASCEIYRITYSTKIRGKIFANECKIVKTTKAFSLKIFSAYGN